MRFSKSLKLYLVVISAIILPSPSLVSAADNVYSLTSDTRDLEGGIFCPDVSIQLFCQATHDSEDIVRWFYSNIKESSNSYKDLTAYPAENAPYLPQKINATQPNAIAGVEVYLTGFRRNSSMSYFYNSTLYINTSLYRSQEYLGFTCGNHFFKSERIDVQFKIQYPISPLVESLTATYANGTVHSTEVYWKHRKLNVTQNLTCSYIYVVELHYKGSNTSGLLDYHIIHYSHCNGIECNTSFSVATELDDSAELCVKVFSTDSILKYNSTVLTYSETVPYHIRAVISYAVKTPMKNCSSLSVLFCLFNGDVRNCTFQCRIGNSDEQLVMEEIPNNATVAIEEVKKSTHSNFILISETENGSIFLKAYITSVKVALLAVGVIVCFIGLLLLIGNGVWTIKIKYSGFFKQYRIKILGRHWESNQGLLHTRT